MKKPKAQGQRTQGVKLMISAAALAATLGGWATLSSQATPEMVAAPVAAVVSAPPAWLLNPPPIPTLQAIGTTPAAVQVPGTQPVVVAPAPALREVVVAPARPAPVTTTQSSR
ncbi:hypothetical protein [Candidatus Chloroploca asiatica]|uniref:Uncharacterized protein n=1 Tax=Candidatus Chloroploca asiatica TaxID=1506545 RepID=A0A2H3L8L7_9CHLR|nr:hypothetical protein [Candidatus Chloroploca asiatica]PDV99660.1 hypothetical protein A9Q02_00085 [Candidatus Chloroploca asiatica]